MTAPMKTPEEIAHKRAQLEKQLTALDDEEQAWYDLAREHRLTELSHRESCKKSHHHWEDNHCKFNSSRWDAPDTVKLSFLKKVEELIKVLPDEYSDEQVLQVIKVAKL